MQHPVWSYGPVLVNSFVFDWIIPLCEQVLCGPCTNWRLAFLLHETICVWLSAWYQSPLLLSSILLILCVVFKNSNLIQQLHFWCVHDMSWQYWKFLPSICCWRFLQSIICHGSLTHNLFLRNLKIEAYLIIFSRGEILSTVFPLSIYHNMPRFSLI